VRRFAALLDALSWQGQRNAKLRLLRDYLAHAPDPDRGYALAALTGGLEFRHAKPALIRGLVLERMDALLFGYSYDYVGDLAETVALIWPSRGALSDDLGLATVVERLQTAGKSELPGLIAGWLDRLDADARWALIKLMTGALRVGVSARLAKTALAEFGGVDVAEVEEIWHAQQPPYAALFSWAEGRTPRPALAASGAFRPAMLAQAIERDELAGLDPAAYLAEWKWDGVRVQVVAEGGQVRLYSRTGEEVSAAFPDIAEAAQFDAVLDGELLVIREGAAASFAELQRRLNRRSAAPTLLRDFPAGVRLYDMLAEDGEDLRGSPFETRRLRLEDWCAREARPRFDLSPLLPFRDWDELAALRASPQVEGVEGVMLKRRDSAYVGGRPKGPWFKWKRDPHLIDAVLMYAQRGHGKRSSFYSDYTFGVWRDGELAPVGKAYFGFTDEELVELDRWVRTNTIARYGPVREVEKALVLEVAFEGVQASSRHRAGFALRFPRIRRIRWDKPAAEADGLEAVARLAARPVA